MKNEQLFDEFEEFIESKYGHMADDMLMFFDELVFFFEEKKLRVDRFKRDMIETLINEYLDFEGLSEVECSMLFQTLIDFCDFCTGKKINYDFFKRYLEEEKYNLYERWSYQGALFSEEDLDTAAEAIVENFDPFYEFMQQYVKKKVPNVSETPDVSEVIEFLETMQGHIIRSFTMSQELCEKYPDLTEEEYLQMVEELVLDGLHDIHRFRGFDEAMFFLPKEQVKKYLMITLKLRRNFQYEPGSPERRRDFEEITADLQDLIDDLKKMEKKKVREK
jgi:hypothetical protein